MTKKIIFFNSYLPRTGHNFSAQVIKIFSKHTVFGHPRSETPLSRALAIHYSFRNNHISREDPRETLDKLFTKDLREKILQDCKGELIMVKDTSIIGVEFLKDLFPNDLHFILIRDPNNVFNSLIKGMNLQKKSFKNRIKKIGILTGLYPWFYSRKLSIQVINEIPDLKKHYIIRYEDLVLKSEGKLLELKDLFQSEKSLDQIKNEIDEIQVINSSFFEEVSGKKIWDSKPKTEKFDPVNRKANSWLIRKGIEIGSRQLRKKLNYI